MEIGSRILPQPEKNQLKMLNIHDCKKVLLFYELLCTSVYKKIQICIVRCTRVKKIRFFFIL